jgi:hypothetical protein
MAKEYLTPKEYRAVCQHYGVPDTVYNNDIRISVSYNRPDVLNIELLEAHLSVKEWWDDDEMPAPLCPDFDRRPIPDWRGFLKQRQLQAQS